MKENPTPESGTGNLPIFSVGEISQALKATVEDAFALVRVRGEISGFKKAASGHLYFALKDADAVLDGVSWRGAAGRLGISPEDGMEVIATGRLTTYPGRSKYQMVVERMELAGEGALLKLLEDRRKKLAAEGLFDLDRKKPIPFLPAVIGVVTSPTGAVIRDILHRLAERFPRHVLLWPVLVQGQGAAEQVAAAIRGFNALKPGGRVPRPDVLIVARGGGSLEDLWAFNEEIVVRAAADSAIPLISAVGHETDTTLIDFASDLRAPTPTAAAEMAVPVRADLLTEVENKALRLANAVGRLTAERETRLADLARGLPRLERLVEEAQQRLDDWSERLANGLKVGVERQRRRLTETMARFPDPRRFVKNERELFLTTARALHVAYASIVKDAAGRFARVGDLLESYSYQRVLERGFALVHDAAGKAVTSAAAVARGMALSVQFSDGTVAATADGPANGPGGDGPERKSAKPEPKPKPSHGKDPKQGSLL